MASDPFLSTSIYSLLSTHSPSSILSTLTSFSLVKTTKDHLFLRCQSDLNSQRCKGSYCFYREIKEVRRLKSHCKWCKKGQELYTKKEVRFVEKNTVNRHRVDKEVERIESQEIQEIMRVLVEEMEKAKQGDDQEDLDLSQDPMSQKEGDGEVKEEEKDVKKMTNRERVEYAKKGGSLMDRIKMKVKGKKEGQRDKEERKRKLERENVYFQTEKRRKTDEDNELPLLLDE